MVAVTGEQSTDGEMSVAPDAVGQRGEVELRERRGAERARHGSAAARLSARCSLRLRVLWPGGVTARQAEGGKGIEVSRSSA